MDHAGYTDWAALRPMTELEYEKTCRGLNNPVYGEYSWGTTNIYSTNYTTTNLGCANENVSNLSTTSGNCTYSMTYGTLLRNGVFAASSANHTRQETGSAYYGVMEMTGMMDEFVVHIGSAAGRSYTGLHGNGEVNESGDADEDYWPGIGGNEDPSVENTEYGGSVGVTAAAGSGMKGENCATGNLTYMTVSSRQNAGSTADFNVHNFRRGSRSVRSAP
jgi:hypothetical protein